MKHQITLTTGESFPFELTMGAMLYFKKETGKEITAADLNDTTELLALLYSCVASGSEVSGHELPYTFQQFANRLTAEELKRWATAYMAEQAAEASKKKIAETPAATESPLPE